MTVMTPCQWHARVESLLTHLGHSTQPTLLAVSRAREHSLGTCLLLVFEDFQLVHSPEIRATLTDPENPPWHLLVFSLPTQHLTDAGVMSSAMAWAVSLDDDEPLSIMYDARTEDWTPFREDGDRPSEAPFGLLLTDLLHASRTPY